MTWPALSSSGLIKRGPKIPSLASDLEAVLLPPLRDS